MPYGAKKTLSDQLEERLIEFAARIVMFSTDLTGTPAGKHIAMQVLSLERLRLPIMRRRAAQRVVQTSFTSWELCRRNSMRHPSG